MTSQRQPNKGSILVTILFMTSILALLVAAVANDSFQSMRSVAQSGRDTQAKYAAYAGLEVAVNELRQDEMFFGEEISERHGRISDPMEGLAKLNYEVLMWNNIQERDAQGAIAGDGEPEDLEGPDGVLVRPDTVYIVSSGTDTLKGEEVLLSSMAGTARRVRPAFEDAAYARTKLALTGADALVDAWDSNGGWEPYVAGDFPGEIGSQGGGGKGGGVELSNVVDHEASLGTDSGAGRTLRLLDGARLNGHFRVGPGVDQDNAFGDDSGSSTASTISEGEAPTKYAVTTAQSPDQVAGLAPDGGSGLGEDKAVVDTKTTEVPRFVSPIADEDCVPGPTLDNQSTIKKDGQGKVVEDDKGNPIVLPPAPVQLAPGGYQSVSVPQDQTLELTSGVYFFRDELLVDGGKITKVGDGPAVVFCGKKATFINAEVNKDGRTSSLQLCFTDDIQDEAELSNVADQVKDIFEGTAEGDELSYFMNLISPPMGEETEEVTPDGPKRRGFSQLEVSGDTNFYGSISGENLVALMNGGDIHGSIMGNVIKGTNAKVHQDLSLKGSNLMAAGGWKLEGVHQIR